MVEIEKKFKMCMLADFYGNMLTEKQKAIFSSYWEKDCSLFEIAEELGITRQAVHDSLNKAQIILQDLEDRCGFIKKYQENKAELINVYNSLDKSDKLQYNIAKQIESIINKL